MQTELIIILVVILAGFVALFWWLKQNMGGRGAKTEEMEALVNQVFGMASQKIAEQSRQVLAGEKEAIHVDLENKQRSIENLVKTLQEEMAQRQAEIRNLEQDRTKKFSEIVTSLEQHRRLTDELKVSTQQLASVLSNNQTRGAWGERIIEDLMQANGLVEGVHYSKQLQMASTTLRPDITLLLPNDRIVPVDVKFPYSEIQKMANAEGKAEKDVHLKQFVSDLKTKINKVAEYINPEAQTLDFAIMFVPNEMIFSFINQKFPELVDEAMSKRVIIVSPFTFLVVARTVIESYRNFMMEDKLRDIIQYVSEFVIEWGKFKDEFSKFGRSIDTLKTGYDSLIQTRTKQMERKINKIDQYQQGSLLAKAGKKVPKTEPVIDAQPQLIEDVS
jgi:DNA recombination protein RmuC